MWFKKWIVLIIIMTVSPCTQAMDGTQSKDEEQKKTGEKTATLTTRQIDALARDLDGNLISEGYVTLGRDLGLLKVRMHNNYALWRGPITIQYEKYKKKYDSPDVDKYKDCNSGLYLHWAKKVRAINNASYGTLFVRAYPKSLLVAITLAIAAGLAAGGYFGYEAYKDYMQKQAAAQQESTHDTQTPEQPTNVIT